MPDFRFVHGFAKAVNFDTSDSVVTGAAATSDLFTESVENPTDTTRELATSDPPMFPLSSINNSEVNPHLERERASKAYK